MMCLKYKKLPYSGTILIKQGTPLLNGRLIQCLLGMVVLSTGRQADCFSYVFMVDS
jgi:hypothetical protein